jgi:hypothetical protein
MSTTPLSATRREVLAGAAAVGAISMLSGTAHAETGSDAIHPFTFHAPEAELDELRRRIAAMRWPEKEIVADHSQGVPLATMQKLADYWATEYDWRKVEAKLNALPNFITEIGWTFISFTFVRNMKMPCRSSLRMDGPARSSSS